MRAVGALAIVLGATMVVVSWPLFAKVFDETADNEAIVYLTAGGVPMAAGLLLLGLGIRELFRRR